jgi:ABC-type lipoprotein release transport system permease subunit
VAIFERGKLSMEEAGGRTQGKARSTSHPLSSWMFYLRHRRRSILLLAAIGLMVLGVALPGFLIGTINDSTLPLYLSYTTHATVVSPGFMYRAVAPDIVAQIRAQPTVAQAIPAKALTMVINLPPGGEVGSIPIYALRLGEGDMVQPRSDQIVLTSALARNRNLVLGDAIGHPVHERDGMPTELTVVGLLDSTSPTLVERAGYDVPLMPRWAGFASYEYVDSHERYAGAPTHLLVVPVEGREAEMEIWLEETIASPRVRIETLGSSYRFWQTNVRTAQATIAIGSAVLSAVAGLGLAIMNYIFVTQRRDEFGTLHAVGYSRATLIARTLRESASIAVVAWLVGAAVCIAGMFYAQATIYTPLGTSLDWTNLAPWLHTLSIPLAVVVASAGTVTWTLSKLDPVAVIERR